MEKWYELMNRAATLNQEAPWIYSNEWYDKFVEEMNHILFLPKEEYEEQLVEFEYILK